MKRRPAIVVISVVLLVSSIVCVLAYTQQKERRTGRVVRGQKQANGTSQKESSTIPEQIFYGEVFSLLVYLKNTDDYKRQAELNDDQALALEETAKDCQREVAEQDAKAQTVIQAFRENMSKEKAGKTPPAPPQELLDLQQERDAIILRHRDRLRAALGEEAFGRFTEAAKNIVHISLTPVQPGRNKEP
jgi:hypothetical protein